MVNASLNWASIVGIVLAVGGAFLYFMRNFKPALARDYDVFFAAIGLLCGGILFFQGWRLDPILQFGQFLLAGTTVFFAYESVRLRGVTTEQARRSSYFDDEEPSPLPARDGFSGRSWDGDSFDAPDRFRQRIRPRDDEDDFYRPRRPSSRAAIPERAVSRRSEPDDWNDGGPSPRREPPAAERETTGTRYSAGGGGASSAPEFGARRRGPDQGEIRRGSRPVASPDGMPRSSRRPGGGAEAQAPTGRPGSASPGIPQGSPLRPAGRSDASTASTDLSDADFSPIGSRGGQPVPGPQGGQAGGQAGGGSTYSRSQRPSGPGSARDNSSRFDD